MKNLGIKQQIFIAIGAAALIITLCALFLWKPQLDKVSSARAEMQNKEKELAQKNNDLKDLKQAKAEAPKIESEALSLSRSIPEDEDIPSLIVEMEQVSVENNVKILKFDFVEPAASGSYSKLDFTAELNGTYFNLADFFYAVSQMARQIKVKKIDFSLSGKGYPLLSAKVDFETYTYATAQSDSSGGASKQ